jgi:hypothetical protein
LIGGSKLLKIPQASCVERLFSKLEIIIFTGLKSEAIIELLHIYQDKS